MDILVGNAGMLNDLKNAEKERLVEEIEACKKREAEMAEELAKCRDILNEMQKVVRKMRKDMEEQSKNDAAEIKKYKKLAENKKSSNIRVRTMESSRVGKTMITAFWCYHKASVSLKKSIKKFM